MKNLREYFKEEYEKAKSSGDPIDISEVSRKANARFREDLIRRFLPQRSDA